MVHAVTDHRVRLVDQVQHALGAQQLRAVHGAQLFEPVLQAQPVDRRFHRQAQRLDAVAVQIGVGGNAGVRLECQPAAGADGFGGFEAPDRGDIVIAGVRANQMPPWRRGLGIVFQSYALFPFMSVFDNVAFGLRRQKKTAGIEARVAAVLELVGLGALAARYPRQLSGGQQQRVALARALAIEPAVLLLDEPLSNLDAQLRAEMRLELKRIQRETGVTTILVTHDQEEALSLSDHMVIMNQGVVVASGTPRELWQQPRHPFVAGFLGVDNLLPALVFDEMRVRPSGCESLLTLPPDPGARAGARLMIGIRAADVRLLPRGAALAGTPNCVGGVVREVNYRGAASVYRIAASGPRARSLLMACVIFPFLLSAVVRAFGWNIVIGETGLINKVLLGLSLIATPIQMRHSEFAIILGEAHLLIPYMVLSLLAVIQRIDPNLDAAAQSLGASPPGVFFRVMVPMTLPGLSAGTLLVFALAMTAFATPWLLGGTRSPVMTSLLYRYAFVSFDMPRALAVAGILLLIGIAFLLLHRAIAHNGGGREQAA